MKRIAFTSALLLLVVGVAYGNNEPITDNQAINHEIVASDEVAIDASRTNEREVEEAPELNETIQASEEMTQQETSTTPERTSYAYDTNPSVLGTTIVERNTVEPAAPRSQSCDENYTPCVPLVSYDLDCKDIGFKVRVIGVDRHKFDGKDKDGWGCESY